MQINIMPTADDFVFIHDTALEVINGVFYWHANHFYIDDDEKNNYTWIEAKQAFWRIRDELLGNKKVYLPD